VTEYVSILHIVKHGKRSLNHSWKREPSGVIGSLKVAIRIVQHFTSLYIESLMVARILEGITIGATGAK